MKKGGEIHHISTMSVLKVWLRIAELYGMVSFFFINLIFHLVKFFVCLLWGGGWGLHYRYNLDQLTLIKPAVVRS